jgi:hypothetical protein
MNTQLRLPETEQALNTPPKFAGEPLVGIRRESVSEEPEPALIDTTTNEPVSFEEPAYVTWDDTRAENPADCRTVSFKLIDALIERNTMRRELAWCKEVSNIRVVIEHTGKEF